MEKIQFKTESKRLLELMIQFGLYQPGNLFKGTDLNASDAIDKLYFRSLPTRMWA